jgi:hypothetical protein
MTDNTGGHAISEHAVLGDSIVIVVIFNDEENIAAGGGRRCLRGENNDTAAKKEVTSPGFPSIPYLGKVSEGYCCRRCPLHALQHCGNLGGSALCY